MTGSFLHCNGPLCSVESGKFLEQLKLLLISYVNVRFGFAINVLQYQWKKNVCVHLHFCSLENLVWQAFFTSAIGISVCCCVCSFVLNLNCVSVKSFLWRYVKIIIDHVNNPKYWFFRLCWYLITDGSKCILTKVSSTKQQCSLNIHFYVGTPWSRAKAPAEPTVENVRFESVLTEYSVQTLPLVNTTMTFRIPLKGGKYLGRLDNHKHLMKDSVLWS